MAGLQPTNRNSVPKAAPLRRQSEGKMRMRHEQQLILQAEGAATWSATVDKRLDLPGVTASC